MQLQNGMSGAEIAEKSVDNGISDVMISVAGQLTDHNRENS
jgi:Zn-dependent membrane protease YugP